MSQVGLQSDGRPRQFTNSTKDGMDFLVGLRLCEGFAIEPPDSVDCQYAPATSSSTCDLLDGPSQKPGEHLSPDGGSDCNTLLADDKIRWLSTKRTAMPSTSFSIPKVSFSDDADDATSSSASHSAPRSILRSRSKNAMIVASDAHGGPIVGSSFRVSDEYLREISISFLEDLISSWNFAVKGCCAWHASVKLMQELVQNLNSFHECSEKWQPDVVWQCSVCTALCGPTQPTDACWICFAPCGVEMHDDKKPSEASRWLRQLYSTDDGSSSLSRSSLQSDDKKKT